MAPIRYVSTNYFIWFTDGVFVSMTVYNPIFPIFFQYFFGKNNEPQIYFGYLKTEACTNPHFALYPLPQNV